MKFEIYKDEKGEWRWRLKARNNRIVAVSGEGYKNRIDAVQAVSLVQKDAPRAKTEIKNELGK